MECVTDFEFGDINCETLRNFIGATVYDYAEVEDLPDRQVVIDALEEYLSALPVLYQSGMVWMLRALEKAPLLMGYRRQFSNLSVEDRVKVLDDFEKSTNYLQRAMILALKSGVLINFFSEPSVMRAIGYEKGCLKAGSES